MNTELTEDQSLRELNLIKKIRPCLYCGKDYLTTRVVGTCSSCRASLGDFEGRGGYPGSIITVKNPYHLRSLSGYFEGEGVPDYRERQRPF